MGNHRMYMYMGKAKVCTHIYTTIGCTCTWARLRYVPPPPHTHTQTPILSAHPHKHTHTHTHTDVRSGATKLFKAKISLCKSSKNNDKKSSDCILYLQQVAKGIEVTDYRFFVRAIIRHSHLITKVTNRCLVTRINPSVSRHSNLYATANVYSLHTCQTEKKLRQSPNEVSFEKS